MFIGARAYEGFMGRWSRMLAEQFVAFASIADARRVLDVGSGTGSLTRAILAAAPNADVVGIDPSPAFVEHAASQIAGRAHFAVGDAQALPFADGEFDACCALLVLNFIADRAKALSEMRRVAKPGGVLAAAVWDHAAGMNMLRIFWEAADAVDPDRRLVEEPQPMLDRDGLIDLWASTGLRDITSGSLTFDMAFTGFADYWEPFGLGQGPAGLYLSGTSSRVRVAIEDELRQRLLAGRPDGPFTLSARAWVVRATKRGD
jgi:ubiquinone/menaquinone biosynthesis C-methylase UbiE